MHNCIQTQSNFYRQLVSGTINPLQKKWAQQEDVIKWEQLKPNSGKIKKITTENMMQTMRFVASCFYRFPDFSTSVMSKKSFHNILRFFEFPVLPLRMKNLKMWTNKWMETHLLFVFVPENGYGSSPGVSREQAAAGRSRKQHPWRFSVVDGRSLHSYNSFPAEETPPYHLVLPYLSLHITVLYYRHFCFSTFRKGTFLAGPAVRLNSSLRSISSSRKTSSAGPSRTSSRSSIMQEY